jgi:hypothetical protein
MSFEELLEKINPRLTKVFLTIRKVKLRNHFDFVVEAWMDDLEIVPIFRGTEEEAKNFLSGLEELLWLERS